MQKTNVAHDTRPRRQPQCEQLELIDAANEAVIRKANCYRGSNFKFSGPEHIAPILNRILWRLLVAREASRARR